MNVYSYLVNMKCLVSLQRAKLIKTDCLIIIQAKSILGFKISEYAGG
jgi:hypothetical protein